MRGSLARSARTAAALFGLVTGALALASVVTSALAAGSQLLALAPLLVLYAANAAVLAGASGVVLARGDAGRLGARVAGVLLGAAALGVVPLVALGSTGSAVGAVLPAVAAAVLLLSSAGDGGDRHGPERRDATWSGRWVLVVVALGALVWAGVGVAGMAVGDGGLAAFGSVTAALTLAGVHAALAAVVRRFPRATLGLVGALDATLGIGIVMKPRPELGLLLVA